MSVVDDFIARYRREFDFYDKAARLVSDMLESRLQAAGVRSMVTFRAKAVGRLERKVKARAVRKNYVTIDDIYDDIPDLAGVRVALYFPGQREQVGRLIDELFVVTVTKGFPDGSPPSYGKRFAGYSATHYRIRLRESSLAEAQKRYAEARVEVQIASVLMHAWAEVEHDLVYKPFKGVLSDDEYAILDELNGMMMAGEIALERLQRAGDVRVAARDRPFANHYELAAHLLNRVQVEESTTAQAGLGRVDHLYELLSRFNLATPDKISSYLGALHTDLERRPIAEQVIDQLLAEDASRYQMYERIRMIGPATSDVFPDSAEPVSKDVHEAIGLFLSSWIYLERLVRECAPRFPTQRGPIVPTVKVLDSIAPLNEETRSQFERIRRMRNHLVHGLELPDPADLRAAAKELDQITNGILSTISDRFAQVTIEMYAKLLAHDIIIRNLSDWDIKLEHPTMVLAKKTLDEMLGHRIEPDLTEQGCISYGGPPYRASQDKLDEMREDYAVLRQELNDLLKTKGIEVDEYLAAMRDRESKRRARPSKPDAPT